VVWLSNQQTTSEENQWVALRTQPGVTISQMAAKMLLLRAEAGRLAQLAAKGELPQSAMVTQAQGRNGNAAKAVKVPFKRQLHLPATGQNILLIGVNDTQRHRPQAIGLMLVNIDAQHRRMRMINLPATVPLVIPGYGLQPVGQAYAYGREQLTVAAVEGYLNVKIDYYLQTNVRGFQNILDTLELEVDALKAMQGREGQYRDFRRVTQEILHYSWGIKDINKLWAIQKEVRHNVETDLSLRKLVPLMHFVLALESEDVSVESAVEYRWVRQ